jgi:hypothetical protein
MRLIVPAAAILLTTTFVPSQARQFEAEAHRSPQLLLTGNVVALAVGDVDGDGDLDALVGLLVTGYLQPQRIDAVLYRWTGAGWQQTGLGSVQGTNGLVPRLGLALVDLDGDADLDAVATISGETPLANARLACWRNDGAGPLQGASVVHLPGVADVQFVAADVDGDGDRDLAVATQGGNGALLPLALYRHDGAFGFTAVAGALPLTPARAPELADLDGDGDADLAAVDAGGNVLVVTNQNGTFAQTSLVAAAAWHVVADDVDGDADRDLLVQRADGSLAVLLQTASGFVPQAVAAGGVAAGQRPVLADVDGDQDRDLVVQVDDELRVLRNGGNGTFLEEVVAAAGVFAAGHADQDGAADVLFRASFGVALARGAAGRMVFDPALLRAPSIAHAARGTTEDNGDLDRDGHVDLVQQDYYRVLVRRNRGAGAWSTVVLDVPFLRPKVRAADVDGDGDEDLAVTNNDAPGGLLVLRNDGNFVFTALPVQPLANAWIAGKGDFDGDSRTDLVIGSAGNALQLLRSTGGGVFAAPHGLPATVVAEAGVADLDGDQDLDLVVPLSWAGCTAVLTNDGAGGFTVQNPCAFPSRYGVRIADIDGDGDADAFSSTYGTGYLLRNIGGGNFVPIATIQGVHGSALLKPYLADWDGDGDQDLLQLGGPAQLWLNTGNGTLVDATAARLGWVEFTAAGAADLDGDGDPDPIGVFGMLAQHRTNHLRSATTLALPTPGGQLQVRFANEPGFAASAALCIPMLTVQPRSAPLAVPGIGGTLQVDLTVSALLPLLTLPAPAGTATTTFAIPVQPGLLGFDLYLQGLVFGTGIAFTPVVHERVL